MKNLFKIFSIVFLIILFFITSVNASNINMDLQYNEQINENLTENINNDVNISEEEITILNQNNKEESIRLNRYQIMKIVKGEENCFLVKFDDLQMVRICRYQELDI